MKILIKLNKYFIEIKDLDVFKRDIGNMVASLHTHKHKQWLWFHKLILGFLKLCFLIISVCSNFKPKYSSLFVYLSTIFWKTVEAVTKQKTIDSI